MLEIKATNGMKNLKLEDFKSVFHEFAAYMQSQTDRTFAEAGKPGSALHGGTSDSRGISWLPVKKGYKKRPSGFGITESSSLLQDTGELRRRAATDIVVITPLQMLMGTELKYANAQNASRPFLFMTEKDADKLIFFADKFLAKQVKGVENE